MTEEIFVYKIILSGMPSLSLDLSARKTTSCPASESDIDVHETEGSSPLA